MIRTGEIEKRNGQIQFSLTVLETTQLRPKLKLVDANPVSSMPSNRINLSGSQVLVGCLSAFCSVGPLLWAFLHLWLFEQ
jgi:alcohol dehydrogenase class IV